MLWVAFGVRIFRNNVAEWQIETVKKYVTKLREVEINHSAFTPAEKDDQKKLWKQWINETTKGNDLEEAEAQNEILSKAGSFWREQAFGGIRKVATIVAERG